MGDQGRTTGRGSAYRFDTTKRRSRGRPCGGKCCGRGFEHLAKRYTRETRTRTERFTEDLPQGSWGRCRPLLPHLWPQSARTENPRGRGSPRAQPGGRGTKGYGSVRSHTTGHTGLPAVGDRRSVGALVRLPAGDLVGRRSRWWRGENGRSRTRSRIWGWTRPRGPRSSTRSWKVLSAHCRRMNDSGH